MTIFGYTWSRVPWRTLLSPRCDGKLPAALYVTCLVLFHSCQPIARPNRLSRVLKTLVGRENSAFFPPSAPVIKRQINVAIRTDSYEWSNEIKSRAKRGDIRDYSRPGIPYYYAADSQWRKYSFRYSLVAFVASRVCLRYGCLFANHCHRIHVDHLRPIKWEKNSKWQQKHGLFTRSSGRAGVWLYYMQSAR